MRITKRIRRRVPKRVVVGTACVAALAAWAGASALDTTDPTSARDAQGARGRPAPNVVLPRVGATTTAANPDENTAIHDRILRAAGLR